MHKKRAGSRRILGAGIPALAFRKRETLGLVHAREQVMHLCGNAAGNAALTPPARSRLILSSASASALLLRPCVSSCVSSPMAKYASCSRAHAPQKAMPRIFTTARWGHGLSVLLRTWHCTGIVASVKKTSFLQMIAHY